MLERPNITNEKIAACLQEAYELEVARVAFLPLGADANTAVFSITTTDQANYFLKLRSGKFGETAVSLPKHLHDHGNLHIIPPLPTRAGRLWAELGDYRVILSPFVAGRDGYEVALTEAQWRQFGAAVRQLHEATLLPELRAQIPVYRTTDRWREAVRGLLAMAEPFVDEVARETAVFLQSKRTELLSLIARAEQLAVVVDCLDDFVVCHADLHAGNLLLDDDGRLFVVDWDTLLLAPKERDLLFVGGGLLGNWRSAAEEVALFAAGYGETAVNHAALAYFRYDRILEDIALYGEELLINDTDSADRAQALYYLQTNFRPNGTIALAREAESGVWGVGSGA